jgi:hypothetical protein
VDLVLPDEADVAVLRAIARGGWDDAQSRRVCREAGCELVAENADVLQFEAKFASGRTVVTVHHRHDGMTPGMYVPLAFFWGAAWAERDGYDRAFRRAADHLADLLGQPAAAGEYPSPVAEGRRLSYCWWSLADAAVVLVQNDEFRPPPDPDISVWVFPPRDEIRLPVSGN